MGKPEKHTAKRTLKELAVFLKTTPRLDDDIFAADIEEIIKNQPAFREQRRIVNV